MDLNVDPSYSELVWELFRTTPRAGRFAAGEADVVTGVASTPARLSRLELQLRMAAGAVADARFMAHGCPTSIAVGAWLAGWVQGRALADLEGMTAVQIRDALEIPDDRAHCALLGVDALDHCLDRIRQK